MKFKTTKDFLKELSKVSKDGKQVQIDLFPKKYAVKEELVRWGEWEGKFFEIPGSMYQKNAEIEWEEDLDEQLENCEINTLGSGFYGWTPIGDDGGYPEPNFEEIKWFSADRYSKDKKEIQLNEKDSKEFEAVDAENIFSQSKIEMLWDEAREENNEEVIDIIMDNDGILKIIVTIDQDVFALINEKYFDECDDIGNWL